MDLEKTDWPDIKTQVLISILIDDLDKTRELLNEDEDLNLIRSLLNQVNHKSRPLKHLTAPLPRDILIAVAYTCGIGCQMCSSGFADRTSLFDDYKYLSPEQFDEILPWIGTASLVVYVGTGETLDSPHIYDFVKKSNEKPSTLTTSGVPLTKEKVKRLIDSNLQTVCFSYDGKTSAGHGSGNEKYSQIILNRIDMVQAIKKELGADTLIIENSNDPIWKGKAYFHLAKREVCEKNYLKAYPLFKETVKHYYEHQLAFVYLYLLMMLREKNQADVSPAMELAPCTA